MIAAVSHLKKDSLVILKINILRATVVVLVVVLVVKVGGRLSCCFPRVTGFEQTWILLDVDLGIANLFFRMERIHDNHLKQQGSNSF